MCIPILEKVSSLNLGKDFKVGYSPERINPGDTEHTIENIVKVVSGSDKECLKEVACTYKTIVKAGVFEAASIKTAEAAKVIENTQRDLNIALVNELALIFKKLNLDTSDVLEAANTKWNFLDFKPGLVGGHCIGVDPYYLTFKSREHGYEPQVILSGRKINDSMAHFIAEQIEAEVEEKGIKNCIVSIFGITFKEDCPDMRNSKVIDIINDLNKLDIEIQITDPLVASEEVYNACGLKLTSLSDLKPCNILLMAVPHKTFKALDRNQIKDFIIDNGSIYDLKNLYKKSTFKNSGLKHWKL